MGPGDDDPALVHSKFRKALQRASSLQQAQGSSSGNQGSGGEVSESVPEHVEAEGGDHVFGSFASTSAGGGSTNLFLGTKPEPPRVDSLKKAFHSEVFRFDSTDRERYACRAISEEGEGCVFSPEGSTPSSSTRSTRSFDSPQITISPLHLTEASGGAIGAPSCEGLLPTLGSSPGLSPTAPASGGSSMEGSSRLLGLHTGLAMLPTSTLDQSRCLFGIPSSPISPLTPNTPLSPSPLFAPDSTFQQGFLAELYRRRCHSDSDLPEAPWNTKSEQSGGGELSISKMGGGTGKKAATRTRKPIPHPLTIIPTKGGSLESDQSSPQDSPLDLSMKGSRERFGSSTSCESLTARFLSSLAIPQHSPTLQTGVSVVRGDVASPTTRKSVALKYNLEVSPVVEKMQSGNDMAFVCPVCGQMFSVHDRLAKHMASRHKNKPHDPTKSYPCDVCHRSFARSDMLTRHSRLHSGIKPYTCKVCGQVFSRSDHLSTHARTHSGEKPYRCPQCAYSACRRDMITRHLRTHSRNLLSSSSSSGDLLHTGSLTNSDSISPIFDHSPSSCVKMELSRPPSTSSMTSTMSMAHDRDSPSLSPALTMSTLSVNSPGAVDSKQFLYK